MANKQRLIDADEAKKALTGWDTDPTDEEIERTIDELPTIEAAPADAVEVVRCKDCKYCFSDERGLWCFRDYENDLKPDDFCSNGERRSDNEAD